MSISKYTLLLLIALVGCKSVQETEPKTEVKDASVIAFAFPVHDIQIDGHASDWPENLTKYPISALLENEIESTEDLDAYFHVGYSAHTKSVYALLTVTDDVHIADEKAGALSDEQDQCLMFLDKLHDAKGSGINVFCFNELYKAIDGAETSWDPNVRNPTWNNVQVASQRVGNQTHYEIQISFEGGLSVGQALGLDFMIYDNDIQGQEDELTRVSWIQSERKEKLPFRIGTVLLVEEENQLGFMEGNVSWQSDSLGLSPNKVRITSADIPSLWIRASVDSTGYYTTQLPTGTYRISPEWGFYNKDDAIHKINRKAIETQVVANTTVKAPKLEIEIATPLNLLPEKGILIENSPNKYQKIDAFVNAYMDFYEIPGASLAIIENGKLSYHQTYGIKNTFTQQQVDEETIFEAASITKPVFAFTVCRLAEKGVIDLDKPLYQYLPFEEIEYDERYKMITARHVLTHKTGFPNWRNGKMTIAFEPGTQFGYSGEGFEYLKRVVAHVTQKDILQVLEEEVLQPLKLENFYFEKNDKLFNVVANGHYYNHANMISLPDKAGMAWSMHTEAASFVDFALALLNREGLTPQTYSDMFTKHTTTDKYKALNNDDWASHFGLGVQIEETPLGLAFGHGGNNGDFLCEFKVYQDLKMGFAIFTNGNTGDQLTYQAMEQFLITGRFK
ncbi:MAG: serine hydrolase [Bacteroidota bacterium]